MNPKHAILLPERLLPTDVCYCPFARGLPIENGGGWGSTPPGLDGVDDGMADGLDRAWWEKEQKC